MVATSNPPTPEPVPPEPSSTIPNEMSRVTFRAMGTEIELLLPAQQVSTGLDLVRELFEEWEQTLSRFRPESELTRVNKLAGQFVIVSPLFFRVLSAALAAAQATDGIYDPTLLRQLSQIGYDRSFETLPASLPAQEYCGEAGGTWRGIQLEHAAHALKLPLDTQLDFGGIAKGMAVDAALDRLYEVGITPAVVNAGGDLRVHGVPPDAASWSIEVPVKDERWTIPLHHGAIATSGLDRRQWRQGGVSRHHLLDPRTGLSVANGLWSVTVVAENCMQAEVAAKVAFILGSHEGKHFLQTHALAGLFVRDDGSWGAGGNWPLKRMRKLQ